MSVSEVSAVVSSAVPSEHVARLERVLPEAAVCVMREINPYGIGIDDSGQIYSVGYTGRRRDLSPSSVAASVKASSVALESLRYTPEWQGQFYQSLTLCVELPWQIAEGEALHEVFSNHRPGSCMRYTSCHCMRDIYCDNPRVVKAIYTPGMPAIECSAASALVWLGKQYTYLDRVYLSGCLSKPALVESMCRRLQTEFGKPVMTIYRSDTALNYLAKTKPTTFIMSGCWHGILPYCDSLKYATVREDGKIRLSSKGTRGATLCQSTGGTWTRDDVHVRICSECGHAFDADEYVGDNCPACAPEQAVCPITSATYDADLTETVEIVIEGESIITMVSTSAQALLSGGYGSMPAGGRSRVFVHNNDVVEVASGESRDYAWRHDSTYTTSITGCNVLHRHCIELPNSSGDRHMIPLMDISVDSDGHASVRTNPEYHDDIRLTPESVDQVYCSRVGTVHRITACQPAISLAFPFRSHTQRYSVTGVCRAVSAYSLWRIMPDADIISGLSVAEQTALCDAWLACMQGNTEQTIELGQIEPVSLMNSVPLLSDDDDSLDDEWISFDGTEYGNTVLTRGVHQCRLVNMPGRDWEEIAGLEGVRAIHHASHYQYRVRITRTDTLLR